MPAVLSHGFIELIDHSGSDLAVVEAARVSYGKNKQYRTDEQNQKLIRYLWRNKHGTPFEMASMKFHVKCPIYVARQWFRHRTFSYNEISGRYVELPQEIEIPKQLYKKAKSNKQGRSPERVEQSREAELVSRIETLMDQVRTLYVTMLAEDIAPEVARSILPVAQYTEFIVCGNLRNWIHFCNLRNENHAQFEIREYAKFVQQTIGVLFPMTHQAWLPDTSLTSHEG